MPAQVPPSVIRTLALAATLSVAAACADSPTEVITQSSTVAMVSAPRFAAVTHTADNPFLFDSYDADGQAGTVYGGPMMADGMPYHVTVKGTWSAWSASTWWARLPNPAACNAEAAPTFATVGVRNGFVGLDAEYRFADIRCAGIAHSENLLFSPDGVAWAHYEPVAAGYNPAHEYTYVVVGRGQRLAVRIGDGAADNYGQLQIGLTAFTNAQAMSYLSAVLDAATLHHGIKNALSAKLRAADAAIAEGDPAAAEAALADFQNQLAAQSGKKVPEALAETLTRLAGALIDAI